MRSGLVAKKVGMTSVFLDSGKRLTLTFLQVDECVVLSQKTFGRDGYDALVIGAFDAKLKKIAAPQRHIFANAKVEPKRKLKEFRVSKENMLEIGSKIRTDHFAKGQYIDVTAKTIGKGFAGGMKRHGFAGLRASHGVSVSHRSHGSTGGCQDPGRVFKNKKMAGRMGGTQVTMQNLRVHDTDVEKGLLVVIGNIPGPKGGIVTVKDAIKN